MTRRWCALRRRGDGDMQEMGAGCSGPLDFFCWQPGEGVAWAAGRGRGRGGCEAGVLRGAFFSFLINSYFFFSSPLCAWLRCCCVVAWRGIPLLVAG